MDLPLSRRDVARIGAALYVLSGLVTLLSLLLPAPRGLNATGVIVVALVALLLGPLLWLLPWQRSLNVVVATGSADGEIGGRNDLAHLGIDAKMQPGVLPATKSLKTRCVRR